MTATLVEAHNLTRRYRQHAKFMSQAATVHAVDGVSFAIARGETLGLVGESGSGKSTVGRLVLGRERADAGSVTFDGELLPAIGTSAWRRQRARMQMIFQDPLGALDRRQTIGEQVREPLEIHSIGEGAARHARVGELLAAVGLSADHARRYPHELSGGQRQRAVLARALATRPDFLVCDEPVSGLDVSIQAQVVNLLIDLQDRFGLTMLFISHDLRIVRQVSRRVAVMYLGRIIETADADDLFAAPRHPYTQALVSAAPSIGPRSGDRIVLAGEPPNPAARPSGCGFHPRCPIAVDRCRYEPPVLAADEHGRSVACHLAASPAAARLQAAAQTK